MSTACCNQEDWVTRPQNGVSIAISKLTACRFGNFIKDASKVGGNLAAFVFLVAAFGLPLPAGGVAWQPQTPPTPQNQSGMEKQRTFHTPIGDAPSPKLHPTRAAHQQSVLRRTAHIFNLLNDICLERWAQWIRLLYTCICLDIFAPMAPKHQFLISLAWRGPRAPLWFFIICFSNLHLPVLCFGYSTRHFPVHGLPIWILNDYWFFPHFFILIFGFLLFFRFIGWVLLIVGPFCGILNKLLGYWPASWYTNRNSNSGPNKFANYSECTEFPSCVQSTNKQVERWTRSEIPFVGQ